MSQLAEKTCVACRGDVPALKGEALHDLSHQLPNWQVIDEHHITRSFKFPDFQQALDFVNRVGGEDARHPVDLGQSRNHPLDAQSQRPNRERFHHGRKDRHLGVGSGKRIAESMASAGWEYEKGPNSPVEPT